MSLSMSHAETHAQEVHQWKSIQGEEDEEFVIEETATEHLKCLHACISATSLLLVLWPEGSRLVLSLPLLPPSCCQMEWCDHKAAESKTFDQLQLPMHWLGVICRPMQLSDGMLLMHP